MTMEEYIREEAERRAKLIAPSIAESMAESMAETLAKPMAESLAASKVAQSILSLAAELGTIPAEQQQRIAGEQAAEDGGHGDPAEGLFRFARLGHGVTFESGTG